LADPIPKDVIGSAAQDKVCISPGKSDGQILDEDIFW
jgi:hypothetical protein